MSKGRIVTKKTVVRINGVEVPAIERMYRSYKRPKGVARPMTMTPEKWAKLGELFKSSKPLHRPKRRPWRND